ncbi:hypothetical protein GBP346_A0530 [Burkholderia pseudomallei MSHR346]|uniref:Uncharacterized protein n=1 Tax=Burkholderia pseudomallei 1710a TaxID=320371 RepID=A0A0E1W3T4_BURPE|nr:hypothetical protein GBP346_A0530 [Burkholderia pseudomallei MSHR346]EET06936.1 hypothetical protein BURPS1710A_0905 [Burkholderia pseudomallei 1710a]
MYHTGITKMAWSDRHRITYTLPDKFEANYYWRISNITDAPAST